VSLGGDISVSEDIESILGVDWDVPRKSYPPKVVLLPTGERMVVREAAREEVPKLLQAITPLLTVERDFYDIVAARQYAELLGWYRRRVRNEFCLVGIVDGKLAGIVNTRAYDQKTHVSYHTLALKRGARAGAHLFAAKHEHSMETLGAEEILVTAESPIGFRRWIVEWGLQDRPGAQHELGGAKTWVITRDIYQKVKPRLVLGSRPVPDDLLKRSATFEIAPLDWVSKN
jgi:hypothetical protein